MYEWFEPSEVHEFIRSAGKEGVGRVFLRTKIKSKFRDEFDQYINEAIRDGEIIMVGGRLFTKGSRNFSKQLDRQLHDTYSGFR